MEKHRKLHPQKPCFQVVRTWFFKRFWDGFQACVLTPATFWTMDPMVFLILWQARNGANRKSSNMFFLHPGFYLLHPFLILLVFHCFFFHLFDFVSCSKDFFIFGMGVYEKIKAPNQIACFDHSIRIFFVC